MARAPKTASAHTEISHDERSKEKKEQVTATWKNFWDEQQRVEADKQTKKVERVRKVMIAVFH